MCLLRKFILMDFHQLTLRAQLEIYGVQTCPLQLALLKALEKEYIVFVHTVCVCSITTTFKYCTENAK